MEPDRIQIRVEPRDRSGRVNLYYDHSQRVQYMPASLSEEV